MAGRTARKAAPKKASGKAPRKASGNAPRKAPRKAAAKAAQKPRQPAKKTAVRTSGAARKRPVAGKAAKSPAKSPAKSSAKSSARSGARAATRRKPPRTARDTRRRDGRPDANWPALSPYLTVQDADAALRFYAEAFGFAPEGEQMRDAGGRLMHAGMRLGGACIMFAPQGMSNEMRAPTVSGAPDSLSLYLYVPDVDALHARAARAGAAVLQPPADQFWGDRIAIFRDPDGYHWTFATHVAPFDASKAPPM